jgi:hypothetical protein
MMVESCTDLATVKEILGVSSLEMVMRYTHPTTEGKMNAVKALERKMEDLGKHHSSTEAKMLSMPKVISNSNNKC